MTRNEDVLFEAVRDLQEAFKMIMKKIELLEEKLKDKENV